MRRAILISLLLFTCTYGLAAQEKEFAKSYKGKYLVVLHDGLAVGTCAEHPETGRGFLGVKVPVPSLAVQIDSEKAEFHTQTGMNAVGPGGCGAIVPEPIHKGELLKVDHAYFFRGREFTLVVDAIAPHAIERGSGAFSHQSFESGRADLRFKTDDPKDTEAVASLVQKWVKVFDSEADAAQFGNTASGVYVKEVKLGMTLAEVEAALGVPETRADLGAKVLYKYKDLTVEFKDGKVVDVR